jgi:hypothetical protein
MNQQVSLHILVPDSDHLLPFVAIRARCGAAGGSFPIMLEFRPGQIAQGICDLALPLIGRVLVDHGRPGGAVAHPLHQLAQDRARASRQDIASMTKIVKVKVSQASISERWEPHPAAEANDEAVGFRWATETEVPGLMGEAYAVRVLDALHDTATAAVRPHDGVHLL